MKKIFLPSLLVIATHSQASSNDKLQSEVEQLKASNEQLRSALVLLNEKFERLTSHVVASEEGNNVNAKSIRVNNNTVIDSNGKLLNSSLPDSIKLSGDVNAQSIRVNNYTVIEPNGKLVNSSLPENIYVEGDILSQGLIQSGSGFKVGSRTVINDSGNLNISLSTEYSAEKHNNISSSATPMYSTGNSVCFLTKVDLEDVDDSTEIAGCHVYASGSYWYLRARSSKDSDAWCKARCIRW